MKKKKVNKIKKSGGVPRKNLPTLLGEQLDGVITFRNKSQFKTVEDLKVINLKKYIENVVRTVVVRNYC